MTGTALVRLGIRVRREQAEIALAALLPILQNGAEETEPSADEVEYAVYAPRAELPKLDDVRALAGDALVDVDADRRRRPAGSGAGTSTSSPSRSRPAAGACGSGRRGCRPPATPTCSRS